MFYHIWYSNKLHGRYFHFIRVPKSLKTDNGSNFISNEFEEYLTSYDIEHRKSTPLWPQANGEVERQHRTLLKALRIANLNKADVQNELRKFLLAYRSTPPTTTGISPAESLLGRKFWTKIPGYNYHTAQANIVDRDRISKQKTKDYADQRRG